MTKKRGRPPSREATTPVCLRLSNRAYDAACVVARRRDEPLAKVLRDVVERIFCNQKSTETATPATL